MIIGATAKEIEVLEQKEQTLPADEVNDASNSCHTPIQCFKTGSGSGYTCGCRNGYSVTSISNDNNLVCTSK